MKLVARIFFLMSLIILTQQTKAQTCETCSVNITSLDSSNYIVGSGQTFCVDTTGNFIGTITLNGGTICNKGIFNPQSITFSSGTISNSGNTSFNSSLNVSSGGQIINNPDAIMNINGVLTNSGGSISNDGITNVYQNLANNSGAVSNNGIINCAQFVGSGSLINSGKINTN